MMGLVLNFSLRMNLREQRGDRKGLFALKLIKNRLIVTALCRSCQRALLLLVGLGLIKKI